MVLRVSDPAIAYRAAINERIRSLIHSSHEGRFGKIAKLVEPGLHRERQHQGLLVTDAGEKSPDSGGGYWSEGLVTVLRYLLHTLVLRLRMNW